MGFFSLNQWIRTREWQFAEPTYPTSHLIRSQISEIQLSLPTTSYVNASTRWSRRTIVRGEWELECYYQLSRVQHHNWKKWSLPQRNCLIAPLGCHVGRRTSPDWPTERVTEVFAVDHRKAQSHLQTRSFIYCHNRSKVVVVLVTVEITLILPLCCYGDFSTMGKTGKQWSTGWYDNPSHE